MRKIAKKLTVAFLTVIIAVAYLSLSGCFGLFNVSVRSISFNVPKLNFFVGDNVEINGYITFTPAKASDKSITAESSDTSVVKIEYVSSDRKADRVYARAVGVGSAEITASSSNGMTAKVVCEVTYAPPDNIVIESEGLTQVGDTLLMPLDWLSEVTLYSRLSGKVDPQIKVDWQVDDEVFSERSASEPFVFTPEGLGSTTISATVADDTGKKYTDTVYLNVFDDPISASVGYEGNLNQSLGKSSAVTLKLESEFSDGNPPPVVQWFVNGEQSFVGERYEFVPQAPGVYTVEGRLNGTAVNTDDGEQAVVIKVDGVLVPQNVWVDYDNCYPNVFIRWDDIYASADYEISIVNRTTNAIVGNNDLSSQNLAIKDKFTDEGFDATAYMTGNANNIFSTRFAVKVRMIGEENGEKKISAWSETVESEKIDQSAANYLNSKFYDGARNYYVSSYEEFFEWFEYAMLWRPTILTGGASLYMNYEFESAQGEIARAMRQMHFTGEYSYSGTTSSTNKNVCVFKIIFKSDGSPSRRTSSHTDESWNAMRPHINYDSSKARSARYVFPIDRKVPVTVTTSDQLYYMAQLGYRPKPAAGSVAERLYNYARRTLRYIVTDDMTDVQKLHAIYDWIMWRVKYDSSVLDNDDISESVKYESYYLESVFTDNSPYGVCDAMSKAFVLMSSIEGFESVRVTGTVKGGGHAWNKVKLGDEWYVVDCTWGDAKINLLVGGIHMESAGHTYFLLSDADIAGTHKEDEGSIFPDTAKERYPWYAEEFEYEGESYDLYFGPNLSTVQFRTKITRLVGYMIKNGKDKNTVYSVPPDELLGMTYADYYAYEFVADKSWGGSSAKSTLRTTVNNALSSRGFKSGDYYASYQTVGDTTHVLLFFSIKSLQQKG